MILLAVMLVGVLGRNALLIKAASLLLVISVMGWSKALAMFESDGIELGILVLTAAVLAPLATGNTGLYEVRSIFRSKAGLASLVAGGFAAVLTGQGVNLLRTMPETVVGLALGSVLGAAFFRGIPAGPLVAAGLAAVLLKVLGAH